MAERPWEQLTDDELERLLVERWLYRGGVLAAAAVLAVLFTMIATRGLESFAEQAMTALLAFMMLAAVGVFVYLRQQDRKIFLALRERRHKKPDKN